MTEIDCAVVRDRLPELVATGPEGDGGEIREHLAGCEACREELALLRRLWAARPEAPAHLGDRVRKAVSGEARRGEEMDRSEPEATSGSGWRVGVRRWSIPATAAAVLVLALGLVVEMSGPEGVTEGGEEWETTTGVLWPSDDGTLAGAPVLDDLSEDDLLTILEEMDG